MVVVLFGAILCLSRRVVALGWHERVAVASNSSAEEHEGWGSQGGLLMVAHADLISQGLSEYD